MNGILDMFEEQEILCGCDIGSFCCCDDPDFVLDVYYVEGRDGWCKKCNKPVYKAGKGSYNIDIKYAVRS